MIAGVLGENSIKIRISFNVQNEEESSDNKCPFCIRFILFKTNVTLSKLYVSPLCDMPQVVISMYRAGVG